VAVNIQQLQQTIIDSITVEIPERVPGYRVKLAETIVQLVTLERDHERAARPINKDFERACTSAGQFLVDHGFDAN
jgi:hypothetical protein